MDPALQQKLAEILDYLLQTTKASVEFAGQQLPLIAWEQVAFARAWHTTLVVLPLVGFAILLHYVRVAYAREADEDVRAGLWAAGLVGGVVCAGVAGTNLYWALMAWFAPRVYLLNWAAELVRTVKR